MIEPYLRRIVVGTLIGLAMYLLYATIARARPKEASRLAGVIAPNKGAILFTTLVCWSFAGMAVLAFYQHQAGQIALWIAAALALCGAACATSLTRMYDIVWDGRGIEGPTSPMFPPIGPKRRRIAWSELTSTGVDMWGSWYVADRDGNAIKWNKFYSGHPIFIQQLGKNAPWLRGQLS